MTNDSSTPRRSLLLATIALALALSGTLMLAAEWYLCATDASRFIRPTTIPGLKYELVPNYHGFYKGIDYRTNQYGFRGESFPRVKPSGEYRVLFLGDSIVQGGHVNEDEAVGARLQALWRTRKGFENTRVINAGVSSYDANDYLAMFKYKGYKFAPDYVVVGLFLNDNARFIAKPSLPTGADKPDFWRRSFLLRAVADAISNAGIGSAARRAKPDPDPLAEIAAAIPDPASVRALIRFFDQHQYPLDLVTKESLPAVFDLQAWAQVRAPLGQLAEQVRQHHAGLLVVVLPLEFQLTNGYVYPEPQKSIAEMCKSLNIDVLDAAPVLRELQRQTGRSIYHRQGDMMHFNAAAHAAVAHQIFEHLAQAGVAPARS